MKRIWIGLGLLALLLASGITVRRKMEDLHQATCQQLRLAVSAPRWEDAISFGDAAKARWEKSRRFTASVADHQEVDQIDSLFAQLEVYHTQGDPLSHAATCAYLEQSITALQEAHRLTWWNLL